MQNIYPQQKILQTWPPEESHLRSYQGSKIRATVSNRSRNCLTNVGENIQSKAYPDLLDRIQKGKKSKIIHQLNLQLDLNGLVRCHGRFGNAELTQGARFPKLLPKDEYFTELVINDVHAKILHSGVSQTLSTIRQVYWIPQGRAAVKRVLSNCRIRKRTGHP